MANKNKNNSISSDILEIIIFIYTSVLNLVKYVFRGINSLVKKLLNYIKRIINWKNYNKIIFSLLNKEVYNKYNSSRLKKERIIEWQSITRNVKFHSSAEHLEKNKRHYKEYNYIDADEQLLCKIYDEYRNLDHYLIKPNGNKKEEKDDVYKKLYYEFLHIEPAGFLEFRHHPEEIIKAVNDYEYKLNSGIDKYLLINAINHDSIENTANKIINEFNKKFNFKGDIIFKINYMEFQVFFDFNLIIKDKYNISHNIVELRFHDQNIQNFSTEELTTVYKRLKNYNTLIRNIQGFFKIKEDEMYNKEYYKSKYYKGVITKSGLLNN